MYTPYLLILPMFSGAGEIIDPQPHASLASCQAELVRMRSSVENEWAMHGIFRLSGECREHDPASWGHAVGRRSMDDSPLPVAADPAARPLAPSGVTAHLTEDSK